MLNSVSTRVALLQTKFKPIYFFASICILCLFYLIFEFFFIPYSVLSADEFVFAHHIYEYTYRLPYRDFSPYKTILGYYLLSIPLFFTHAILTPLFYIKDEIAVINMFALAGLCYFSTRFFAKRAILLTVLAIIANQFFLVYSADLRVDMLTSWMCLFAACCVLQNRFAFGGFLLSIAFLISQKALWYVFAIDGAMLLCWQVLTVTTFSWRTIGIFNVAFAIPIIVYIFVWSSVSSVNIVLHNLFYEAYIQAGIDWFQSIYIECWYVMFNHGPILFLLWPLTFLCPYISGLTNSLSQQRFFIITFSAIAILLFIHYKQPFPYNFVFTIPAFFLLYAEFFSWLLHHELLKNKKRSLFFLISLTFYCLIVFFLIHKSDQPVIYYGIGLLPIIVSGLPYFKTKQSSLYLINFYSALCIFIFTGIAYPLYRSVSDSSYLSGKYQQTILNVTAALIKNDNDYVSGIPFFYNKDQPIAGLKNLIGPAIDYLEEPDNKIKLLLLPSLYLSATNVDEIITQLEQTPIKVVINNYRISHLPPTLLTYLNQHYRHYYGSIYLYAPTIFPEQHHFMLKFSAWYQLVLPAKEQIHFDGQSVKANTRMYLKAGPHFSVANNSYRLVLQPDIPPKQLNPTFKQDEWVKMIKAILG